MRFKRTHNHDLPLPQKNDLRDAGYDLCSAVTEIIYPGQQILIPTGWAGEIPDGYSGLIWPRSGLSTKQNITTMAGVIDSGYRGEIQVLLYRLPIDGEPYTIEIGDKIAQLVVHPIFCSVAKEVDQLSETDRGANGFGSSGR